ncbi:Juvenile hormone epoxide hydrolase 1 [Trichinella pseudospiralis]|uniref:Juvenile hormone epoxide hydrolase 1 n=1 Tax=Trichinella pseudospiralis TaxID=6337 RepID=A0A0V0YA44_TRIPS|nr:Juvenile hormone epoxide hydrolase 1 [Trichinella pseudospiralis]
MHCVIDDHLINGFNVAITNGCILHTVAFSQKENNRTPLAGHLRRLFGNNSISKWFAAGVSGYLLTGAAVSLQQTPAKQLNFWTRGVEQKLPALQATRKISSETDCSNLNLRLYQYQNCPFCCKVRSYLDYYGYSYELVEVNPITRKEIKFSEYKKVPILVCGKDDPVQINDSSVIISFLQSYMLNPDADLHTILSAYPSSLIKGDDKKMQLVSPNKYFLMIPDKQKHVNEEILETMKESLKAFQWFSEVSDWRNTFHTWERLTAVYLGATYLLWKDSLPVTVDEYYSLDDQSTDDEAIYTFEVKVPDSVLNDLQVRLNNTKFFQALENSSFFYGSNANFLHSFHDYWMNSYNWRETEAMLNNFKHFRTQIEGLNVHYIHAKPAEDSKYDTVYPLLLVHGWPGSISEFLKIIPILIDPMKHSIGYGKKYAFEVIAPSIPGFAWSDAPKRKGFGPAAAARVYPERVIGLHLNTAFVPGIAHPMILLKQLLGIYFPEFVIDPADQYRGLLCKILQWDWHLIFWKSSVLGLIHLINISTTFLRCDFTKNFTNNLAARDISISTGVAAFPNDLLTSPQAFVTYKYVHLVQYSRMPRGGHFAALEEPLLLADDIYKFSALIN